ncbi:MAG: hypothetical protein WC595_03875 [Candidatus Nanoarchaeia archaeon]
MLSSRTQLFIYEPLTGTTTPLQLSAPVTDYQNIQWSADGTKLLFEANVQSTRRIYVYTLQTNQLTPLTPLTLPYYSQPEWSPDNQYLTYESDENSRNNLIISRSDGTQKINPFPTKETFFAHWITRSIAPPPATSVITSISPTPITSPSSSPTGASFFITSEGNGINGANGGNYGGLNGADTKCQTLATRAGLTATWHAYLSTSTANARDRIGNGPWYNFKGEKIADSLNELHTNGIKSHLIYDEKGNSILNSDDTSSIKTDHDVLTGSTLDGRVQTLPSNPGVQATCNDWTSNNDDSYGWQGHADWSAKEQQGVPHWTSAHESACSKAGLNANGGSGKLYCFAV